MIFSIVLELGALGFYVAAMYMMPSGTPEWIRLLALSFFWLGISILFLGSHILNKIERR